MNTLNYLLSNPHFRGFGVLGFWGFGVSVGFMDGIREDTVVEGVTIWDGSGMLLDGDGRGVGNKSHDGETGSRFHF
jgi:hypothetical protein